MDIKTEKVEVKTVDVDENEAKPKNVQLEEDTILYEKPQISEEEKEEVNIKKDLNVYEQIYIQAIVNFLVKTSPKVYNCE